MIAKDPVLVLAHDRRETAQVAAHFGLRTDDWLNLTTEFMLARRSHPKVVICSCTTVTPEMERALARSHATVTHVTCRRR